jgi:hypothetical protein
MRNHFDNFSGAIALSYFGATVAGFTLNEWSALAALCLSLLLIVQKLWQFVRWLRTPKSPA